MRDFSPKYFEIQKMNTVCINMFVINMFPGPWLISPRVGDLVGVIVIAIVIVIVFVSIFVVAFLISPRVVQ